MQGLRTGSPQCRAAARVAQGVSLIEALIALVVLSFGVMGMAALHARAVQYAVDAEDRNRAALLAEDLASTMWLAGSTSLPTATVTAWQTRVTDAATAGLPHASGTVTRDANGMATITVSWRPPSRSSTAGNLQYVTKVVLP